MVALGCELGRPLLLVRLQGWGGAHGIESQVNPSGRWYLVAETLPGSGWEYHFLTFSAPGAYSGCAHRPRKALPSKLPCAVGLEGREGTQRGCGLVAD